MDTVFDRRALPRCSGAWRGWLRLGSLGKRDSQNPLVVEQNADGTLQCFLSAHFAYSNRRIISIRQRWPGANGWTEWFFPSPQLTPTPALQAGPFAVARDADGRLETFIAVQDVLKGAMQLSSIYRSAQSPVGSNCWTPYTRIASRRPGYVALQAVMINADRLAVYVAQADGTISYACQEPQGANGWSPDFVDIGGLGVHRGPLRFVRDQRGVLHTLVNLGNGNIADHSGRWSNLGGALASLAAPRASANGLDLLGIGWDGSMQQNHQPALGAWQGWETIATPLGRLSALVTVEEDFFAMANGSSTVVHGRQPDPDGQPTGWSVAPLPEAPIEFGFASLKAMTTAGGKRQVFVRSVYNDVWTIAEDSKAPCGWSDWLNLGSPGDFDDDGKDMVVQQNAVGRLELFIVTRDGVLWHNGQMSPS